MVAEAERIHRTYFNHPLVEESIQCLAAALTRPSVEEFQQYVVEHVPQNSLKGRKRIAGYLTQRFFPGGRLNVPLAAAVAQFGDSRISREILFFELLRVYPVLEEIAIHWLAALPPEGAPRSNLLEFLEPRIPGRSTEKVAKDSLTTLKQLGKVRRPKAKWYAPIWSEPPLEVFLYALGRAFPNATMERVDLFLAMPIQRAMLWPPSSIESLLQGAERAGHISRISKLDQYHQFTLAGSGAERLNRLLPRLAEARGQQALFEEREGE